MHEIVENMPFYEYEKINAMHFSLLKHMPVPRRFKHAFENPKEPTPAMELGSALHCLTLEPERFAREWLPHPEMDKRTKEWKEWLLKNNGTADKMLVSERVISMGTELKDLPSLSMLLEDKNTKRELSVFWTDKETNLDMKARLDVFNSELLIIGDVKTTKNGSPEGFAVEVFKNNYHLQAAIYSEALKAHGIKIEDFVFFCVENTPPHLAACYRLLDDVRALGIKQMRSLLSRYHECQGKNEWPGYAKSIQDIGVPTWSLNQLEVLYGE